MTLEADVAIGALGPTDGAEIVPGPIETGDPAAPIDGLAPPAPLVALPPARVVPRRVCQIAFAGMLASEQARVEVHAWVERLGELTSSLTAGQVLIEAVDRNRKERLYRVRMELTLRTGVVVVDYDHHDNRPHEDVYVAIRNAFRAARRQLESLRR
jgi:ribosome-associated translation inhibitor RaiA